MTHVLPCDECDGHDEKQHIEDGLCRECRGIDRPDMMQNRGYVSPDELEKNWEYYNHAANHSRHAVISNRSNK